jgi:hypothetical protein
MLRATNEANTGRENGSVEQRSDEMFAKTFVVTWTPGIASVALPAFSQSEALGNNEVSCRRSAAL